MAIAPDSKSYPYLALAQRWGADYGVVLRVSDIIEDRPVNAVDSHWFRLISRGCLVEIRDLVDVLGLRK